MYWAHAANQSFSKEYPYLSELKVLIERYDKAIILDSNHAVKNDDYWNFIKLYISDPAEASTFKAILQRETIDYTGDIIKSIKYRDNEQNLPQNLRV